MRISDWSSDVCSSDLPIVTTGPHDATAEVDRAALELVLGHLIQNAIEASPPTEPVTLAVSTDGERVAIDVTDRRCGMTPAFVRDQLYRPFVSSSDEPTSELQSLLRLSNDAFCLKKKN